MSDVVVYILIVIICIILIIFWKKISDLESLARITSAWVASDMIDKMSEKDDQPETRETDNGKDDCKA